MAKLLTPYQHETAAFELKKQGKFSEAADEFRKACAASVGNKRRDRYDEWAEECEKLAHKEIELMENEDSEGSSYQDHFMAFHSVKGSE